MVKKQKASNRDFIVGNGRGWAQGEKSDRLPSAPEIFMVAVKVAVASGSLETEWYRFVENGKRISTMSTNMTPKE